MSKIKTVFWIVVIGLIVLVFFQNQGFFLTQYGLRINLLFIKYQSPEVPSVVLFLAFFLAGLLMAYFFGLAERFRLKKMIKNLTVALDSQVKKMPLEKKEETPFKESLPDREENTDNR